MDDFILASELLTSHYKDDTPKDVLEDSFGVLLARGGAPVCAATVNLYAPDHARIQVRLSAARRGPRAALRPTGSPGCFGYGCATLGQEDPALSRLSGASFDLQACKKGRRTLPALADADARTPPPNAARAQSIVSAEGQRRKGHAALLVSELHGILADAGLARVVAVVAEVRGAGN